MKSLYGIIPAQNINFDSLKKHNLTECFQDNRFKLLIYPGEEVIFKDFKDCSILLKGSLYNRSQLLKLFPLDEVDLDDQPTLTLIRNLIAKHGIDGISRLNGNFFLIYFQKSENTFYIAQSKISTHAIYYSYQRQNLTFSDSLRGLLSQMDQIPPISPHYLLKYFTYGFVPSPHTPFENIKKLSRSHMLVFNGEELKIKTYWNISFPEKPNADKTLNHYCHDVLEEIKIATQRRIASQSPIGVFLSGGLDSSSIVATLNQVIPETPIQTFTAAFNEKTFDESDMARKVSQRYQTQHKEVLFTGSKALTFLEKFIQDIDEPFSDDDVICGGLLSEFATGSAEQIFLGDGPDELFMGYPSFWAHRVSNFYDKLPGFLQNSIENFVSMLPVSYKYCGFDARFKQFSGGVGWPSEIRDAAWWGPFPYKYQKYLFSEDTVQNCDLYRETIYKEIVDVLGKVNAKTHTNKILTIYLNLLSERWFLKLNAVQRKTALKFELPFLDENFIELVNQIPEQYKQKPKYILRQTMKDFLPKEIIQGKKRSFFVPLALWIKNELKDLIADNLTSEDFNALGLLNKAYFQALMNNHFEGKENNAKQLWNIFIFMAWYKSLKNI